MFLIDKPKGITSFDVIRILRKRLKKKKIGHAGTLDPLASGLLLVAVGSETKELKKLVELQKTYEVEVLIGELRETGDMEGKIVETLEVQTLEHSQVERAIKEMIGIHNLPVPKYSAIKQGGEPLYKKARRGEKVEVPNKQMEIYNMALRDISCANGRCVVSLTMEVSSGSYVRALVEELGRRLGYPATTKELRRTSIGTFDVQNAVAPENVVL